MDDNQTATPFSQWAIVEIMGRQVVAGLVTEVTIAGSGFLRVDVPVTSTQPAWSRLISPQAIYAITPTKEDVATARAESLRVKPLHEWDLPSNWRDAMREGLQMIESRETVADPNEPNTDHNAVYGFDDEFSDDE